MSQAVVLPESSMDGAFMAASPARWRAWGIAGFVLIAHLVASLSLGKGYAIWVFGDALQSLLLASFLIICIGNARKSAGSERSFWVSLALGAVLWLAATVSWSWYEVVLRQPVPDPYPGDVSLFLHTVPMMGALAFLPHRRRIAEDIEFSGLDFSLLLIWWLYLYLVVVIPWQYVTLARVRYDISFNLLYTIEQVTLLAALAALAWRTRGGWRHIYGGLFAAGLTYGISSRICNYAIEKQRYYTGSIYDIPLVLGELLFILVAFEALVNPPRPMQGSRTRAVGIIAARLAMLAVISLPILAIYFGSRRDPARVIFFRMVITTSAMILLPALTFIKQHLLNQRLVRLWRDSQRNYENQKRLQEELIQVERLASMGELVAGAVHEINNPLTAIIGYSDLLADDTELSPDRKGFVTRIGEQARRVRDLVANLRSFSQPAPGEKKPVDLNALVAQAVELRSLDLRDNIRIEQQLQPGLPAILGDSNGLLQVCFHIIANAVDAMENLNRGVLKVSTRAQNASAVVEFMDNGPGLSDPTRIFDPFYTTKPVGKGTGLGLSVCYGIVQNHHGQIVAENCVRGGAKFTLILPLSPTL